MSIYRKMNRLNTALLVIDVVNGCANKNCEKPEFNITFSKIREMVPRLDEFINEYREKINENIIFVNITPWTREFLPNNIQELYTDPSVVYYSYDKTGFSEQFYQVRPGGKDIVITKNTYDAFASGELEKTLREKKVQFLVVTGIFTEGCVLSTVVNGFSKGFNFVIIKNLVETADNQERQETSELLKKRVFPYLYGKTILAREFLNAH